MILVSKLLAEVISRLYVCILVNSQVNLGTCNFFIRFRLRDVSSSFNGVYLKQVELLVFHYHHHHLHHHHHAYYHAYVMFIFLK